MNPLTLVLYGGPGVGKSTVAAGVFAELKMRKVNVEWVTEVAKGLAWEKRDFALSHQAYINAKQMFHMDRLRTQVDCIVTDTSTLLGLVYGENLTPEFKAWILSDYRARNTLNVFLRRSGDIPYSRDGRYQTEQEAQTVDHQLLTLLRTERIPFHSCAADPKASSEIVKLVLERL